MDNGFQTDLCAREIGDSAPPVYQLLTPLVYIDSKGIEFKVPAGFMTDLASIPRLPLVWLAWGDRAHRPAVLHDYLYRLDSVPIVERSLADYLFREAIISTGASAWKIAYPMWMGVRLGGWGSYHKRRVAEAI